MQENSRQFMKCQVGTRQSLKSGPNYLSTLIACALHGMPRRPPALSVTINASSRIFLRLYSNHGLFCVQRLPAAAWEGD